MLRIGDFSRLGRTTVVTLRHYDDLGLLVPARVDPETGYRYYTVAQLPQLHRILALRDLGFTLEQIARMLREDIPAEQIRGMLALRRAELEQQMHDQQARLLAVEARLCHLEREGAVLAYDVRLRSVPALQVAAIREVVPTLGRVEALFDELETYVAGHKARAASPPLTIYHDADYRERDVDIEVAVPVIAPLPSDGRINPRELPAVASMASVIHTGSYSTIDGAASAVFAGIATQGYVVAGPQREIYLRFGAGPLALDLPDAYLTDATEQYVTELQVPVTHPQTT
jgi:DNA-binding transcriptional MerR regulator